MNKNIFKTEGKININLRSKLKNQKAKCIWLTGFSGSGKSTIAQALEYDLFKKKRHCYILDGDNLRYNVSSDLGFSKKDKSENLRRVAEISKLMFDAGLIVIVALISPYEKDRKFAKSLFKKKDFIEIYVSTPLGICKERDPKKLYINSKNKKNFDMIGTKRDYQKPKNPDLAVDTSKENLNDIVKKIIKKI
tara:strand:- start:462 stop:1037 length:576 start_codon:yes stop_codon:yes gene_type:complete